MEIIYTPKHRLHHTVDLHVNNIPYITDEIPARAEVILQAVTAAGLGAVHEPQDYGLEPILAVHDPELIDFIQSGFAQQVAQTQQTGPLFPEAFPAGTARHPTRHPSGRAGLFALGPDCPLLAGTWEAAYWSAQCALTGAARLLRGETAVFALCRPPGHHATTAQYGGYCYLNNAAIAARYLQNQGRARRVAILDLDYHHGNGTQEIFYRDPTVMYCSLHAHPDDDYPYYWGSAAEAGAGRGEGYTCNWPLPQGTDDETYAQTLNQALDAIVCFSPEYLLVSLGLDTAAGDPLGGFVLTRAGFAHSGAAIASLNLPTLIVQEGGYLLQCLGDHAVAFLENFSEEV